VGEVLAVDDIADATNGEAEREAGRHRVQVAQRQPLAAQVQRECGDAEQDRQVDREAPRAQPLAGPEQRRRFVFEQPEELGAEDSGQHEHQRRAE
jgi:hypothetical protein